MCGFNKLCGLIDWTDFTDMWGPSELCGFSDLWGFRDKCEKLHKGQICMGSLLAWEEGEVEYDNVEHFGIFQGDLNLILMFFQFIYLLS